MKNTYTIRFDPGRQHESTIQTSSSPPAPVTIDTGSAIAKY